MSNVSTRNLKFSERY